MFVAYARGRCPLVCFHPAASTMNFAHIIRPGTRLAVLACCVMLFAGCAASPEATAQWYLSDKPADMRVPVSGQTDPGAPIAPVEE